MLPYFTAEGEKIGLRLCLPRHLTPACKQYNNSQTLRTVTIVSLHNKSTLCAAPLS
jgi:hypothetical protein